jgi:hypothetical protein
MRLVTPSPDWSAGAHRRSKGDTEEAVGKDRFGRVQVRNSSPKEEERSERDGIGSLSSAEGTWLRVRGPHNDPGGRLVFDIKVNQHGLGENKLFVSVVSRREGA